MSADVFEKYSAYYDLLYRDKDYAGEVAYLSHVLSSVAPKAKSLLEFGSGTGRHGRLLASKGFNLFGVERSESMVAEAKRFPSSMLHAPSSRLSSVGAFDSIQGDI